MLAMRAILLSSFCADTILACSSAIMNNSYRLAIHTMDLPSIDEGHGLHLEWQIIAVPKGGKSVRSSEHGYVAFFPKVPGLEPPGVIIEKQIAVGGLNDAGLSCTAQVLSSEYPKLRPLMDNINVMKFCRWAFEGFDSVAEMKKGLDGVNFIGPFIFSLHFAVRDSTGASAIVEFIEGKTVVHDDFNDGVSGFGIMTNDPPFPWQVENVKHLQWKQKMSRSSVTMPGSWYPDERFVRLHLVKAGMPVPSSYEEAFMQAAHVLNTVTVPMGAQMGTDGPGDHTQFGAVYDHKNLVVYWRTEANQNFQRLRLADADIAVGGSISYLPIYSSKLSWFSDAADKLVPNVTLV